MSQNILITGASGYLGGTILARWSSNGLPPHGKLYALVRTEAQANSVKQYGAEPLTINLQDKTAVREAIVSRDITIVFFLIDVVRSEAQVTLMEALAEVKEKKGGDVHFLHTSGAKIFSSLTGAPTDRPLLDTDPNLYDIQKSQKAPFAAYQPPVNVNNTVVEEAEALGVRSYIFAPCIVYGKGEGFGNAISIQTVAIVQAAKAVRSVYSVDDGRPTWPVCHLVDTVNLYFQMLRAILSGQNMGSGKQGYYPAASGSVAWEDIYSAFAAALAKRGFVDDATVRRATPAQMDQMGAALGCPGDAVPLQLGGLCTFTAENGYKIGWKPEYRPEHILESAQEEVDLILANL